MKIDVVCSVCQQTFQRPDWYLKRPGRKTCSDKCRAKLSKKPPRKRPEKQSRLLFACETCGIEFERLKTRGLQAARHFCSQPCQAKAAGQIARVRSAKIPPEIGHCIVALGYLKIYMGRGAGGSKTGFLLYHRYLMEQHLNRSLGRHELVHHINGDKMDNRLENLQIVTAAEHRKIHGGTIPTRPCTDCGKRNCARSRNGIDLTLCSLCRARKRNRGTPSSSKLVSTQGKHIYVRCDSDP